MKKSRSNNVFRNKEITSNVEPNTFRGFEVRKKIQMMFLKPNDSMKGKCYVFSGSK